MQIGKGRHSRPEVCCSPLSSWVRSSGTRAPGWSPSQPDCQARAPSVVGGEVRKVDLHSWVRERHGFAVRSDDASAGTTRHRVKGRAPMVCTSR